MNENVNSEVKWLPVVGYEKLYKVSNFGDVFSLGRTTVCSNGVVKIIKPKMLSPHINGWKRRGEFDKGYFGVTLTDICGKRRSCNVHQIVAQAFILNPDNKPTVNHIDGDKHNNRVDNLEWNTYQENNQHAADNELKSDLKPIIMLGKEGKELMRFKSIHDAGDFVNGSFGNIHSVCNGTRNSANGYGWKYAE